MREADSTRAMGEHEGQRLARQCRGDEHPPLSTHGNRSGSESFFLKTERPRSESFDGKEETNCLSANPARKANGSDGRSRAMRKQWDRTLAAVPGKWHNYAAPGSPERREVHRRAG